TCEKTDFENARPSQDFQLAPEAEPEVRSAPERLRVGKREKVKCYMNFSGPENIFLLNLWQDPRPTRDFSRALSAEFYQGKLLVHQTCEKTDFENARPSQDFQLAPEAEPEVRHVGWDRWDKWDGMG
ncbi:MAG: hypothetical protein ABL904_17295, partial [Hyphomicrobiaceae bacterium]